MQLVRRRRDEGVPRRRHGVPDDLRDGPRGLRWDGVGDGGAHCALRGCAARPAAKRPAQQPGVRRFLPVACCRSDRVRAGDEGDDPADRLHELRRRAGGGVRRRTTAPTRRPGRAGIGTLPAPSRAASRSAWTTSAPRRSCIAWRRSRCLAWTLRRRWRTSAGATGNSRTRSNERWGWSGGRRKAALPNLSQTTLSQQSLRRDS